MRGGSGNGGESRKGGSDGKQSFHVEYPWLTYEVAHGEREFAGRRWGSAKAGGWMWFRTSFTPDKWRDWHLSRRR
jgi:hypothetical protein